MLTGALFVIGYALLTIVVVALFGLALALLWMAFIPLGMIAKALEAWFAGRRDVSRRLKAPARGNALVNWRRA